MIDAILDALFGKACQVVVVHSSGATSPCLRRDHATTEAICRLHLALLMGKPL